MGNKLTYEEKREITKDFRPIDDVFFELLAANREVCEEILQTILEDRELNVDDVMVQSSERNIYGRSVRLDALCTLGDGRKCNIEVQRSDNDNHKRRVRFNASSITVKESTPGDKFTDVVDVCVVYISEFDVFGYGKTIYHVDKILREANKPYDDGLEVIFVNTAVNDGTDIAELMLCFIQKEVNNPKFPKLSNEVRKLKETEGGLDSMCTLMEKYNQEAINKKNEASIIEMLKDNLPYEKICRYLNVSIDEILKVKSIAKL